MIKITTDSTCDLPVELLERHHISVIPLGIVKGGRLFHDGVDIRTADIAAHVDAGGDITTTNAVNIAGTLVPGLKVRRTDTSISLADGESFVISGLISTRNSSQVDKFPGLGDIPILGAFFRSSNISREERELLMIVTPHLIQPLAATAQLPSLPGEKLRNYDPNWYRLYFLENGNFNRRSGLSK